MGRTGTWWAHQQLGGEPGPPEGPQPDILIFAKGIASGFPFAGVATRAELYDKMAPGMMVGLGWAGLGDMGWAALYISFCGKVGHG